MASELEAALRQGVKDGKVPMASIYATNRDGSFQYHYETGFQHYGIDDAPLVEDPVLMLASQSKLLTAISALKAVELGLIGLDDDVTPHLPELGALDILEGFTDDDKPILVARKNPITLRQLVTHSSGTTYDFHPLIQKYKTQHGHPGSLGEADPTIAGRYNHPLVFEPGTSWAYSCGLDWTGLLILRISGMDLEAFEQKYLWTPLNVTNITFWPKKNPALADQIPQLVVRSPDGKLVPNTAVHLNTHSTDCFGGHGVHARLSDYLRVLHSLLVDDGRLLRPASVDLLFAPQLGAASEAALNKFMQYFHPMMPGEINPEIPVQYGVGGMVFMADDAGRRKKGSLSWTGLFNPFWLIDREAGLALTFGTQMLPPGDPGAKEMTGVAEKAVYKMAGVS